MMKKKWAIRKDAEAVSPVIATILMVAITVVLAAVLYVMVLGFGGTSTQTPTSSVTKSTITFGVKWTFAPFSKDTAWSDVSVILSDDKGNTATAWKPATTNLNNGTTAKWNGGSKALGTITNVWLNITDLAGNGYVNQGDFVTLTTLSANTFSSSTTYTVTIMHNPSSSKICDGSFNG